MNLKHSSLLLGFVLGTAAIAGQHADMVLTNANIYTVNPNQPWATAAAITNGVFMAVGNNQDVSAYIGPNTEVIDLSNRMVMPGVHDVHTHPLEAGSEAITCVLNNEQPIGQWLNQITQCHSQTPGNDWLLGWGHALEPLLDSADSPVNLLDAISNQRPIAIMEFTSHSFWVNSAALSALNIDANTEIPPVSVDPDLVFKNNLEINWNDRGGAILKTDDGEPNGLLLDAAGEMVLDHYYQPSPSAINGHYNSLLYGLDQLAQNGITSVVDSRVYWKRGHLEAWQRAEQNNRLTVRAVLSLWAYPWDEDDAQIGELTKRYYSNPNALLKVNQIKMYSDGILHNSSAALSEPYLQFFHEIGQHGLNYFSQERMEKYITALSAVGFDVQIHAIGDRGVHEALNAIEASSPQQTERHRITHVEMVNPADLSRFTDLNVVADFQLAGDFTDPSHFSDLTGLIGNRTDWLLPVRDVLDTGATVTLSSDWDVSALSPFVGMQNALTRQSQSFPDLASVIKSYTINGAYVMRQEHITGSIEIGKQADFIVLSQNIFDISPSLIAQTQVLETYLGGERVYPF